MYNVCMNKRRAGFTLVELITVMALLAIGVTMFGVVIANMVRTQNASSSQYSYARQINDTRSLINDYCSFVSLKTHSYDETNGITFTYVPSGDPHTSITFTDGEANYTLSYSSGELKILNDSSSTLDYLKYSKTISVPDVQNFVVYYDQDLALVNATFSVNAKEYHHIALVRCGL